MEIKQQLQHSSDQLIKAREKWECTCSIIKHANRYLYIWRWLTVGGVGEKIMNETLRPHLQLFVQQGQYPPLDASPNRNYGPMVAGRSCGQPNSQNRHRCLLNLHHHDLLHHDICICHSTVHTNQPSSSNRELLCMRKCCFMESIYIYMGGMGMGERRNLRATFVPTSTIMFFCAHNCMREAASDSRTLQD